MKKRVIDTKRLKRWKLIDRLRWLIPLVVALIMAIRTIIAEDAEASVDIIHELCFADGDYIGRRIFLLAIAFTACVMFVSIPFMILWRLVTKRIRRSVQKAATFNPTVDLTYYREKLKGLSPTDISLLTDLKLESDKDITALVLKYSMMGLVETNGGEIKVISKSHPDLKKSDEILLSKLESHSRFISDWQKAVIEEASCSPYFKKDASHMKNFKKGCLTQFIMSILMPIIGFAAIFIWSAIAFEPINKMLEQVDFTEAMVYDVVVRNTGLYINVILMVLVAMFFLICWYYPIVSLIGNIFYLIFNAGNICFVKRTETGEQLVEYIYGMKNFIHDFSMLSEAQKEQLILWDEFLIYAVLLEENNRIVNEIAGMRKQSIWKFNGSN